MESKFKVGDKVRMVRGGSDYLISAGEVCEVKSIAEPNVLGQWIMLKGKRNTTTDGSYLSSEFELVEGEKPKFKEGDVVRYPCEVGEIKAGTIAKIHDVYNGDSFCVTISGDKMFYAHSGELEPWKPRVGERVRFTDECRKDWWFGPHTMHKEGTVYSVGLGECDFTISLAPTPTHSVRRYAFVELKHIEPASAVAVASQASVGTIPKFKVGDTVVRTAESSTYYTKGRIYKITREAKRFYQLTDDRGNTQHIWTRDEIGNHFVIAPIATTQTPPTIVCPITNGQPLPADNPVVHTSTSAAEDEANRLANKHKG